MEGNAPIASRPAPTPMLVISCCIVLMLASMLPASAPNTTIHSFNHAKQRMVQIFVGHETEFSCGCPYVRHEVNLASCR
jgi:endonuclease I